MKKLISSLFIALTGAAMVACNSGGSSSSGNGLSLSASANQCSYGGNGGSQPLYNTSITYTINGTTPGHQYGILATNIWSGDKQNNPVSDFATAESNTLTIVATCEYLQFPIVPAAQTSDMTGSTDAFAVDMTATQSSGSLVSSNSLQYTVNYLVN